MFNFLLWCVLITIAISIGGFIIQFIFVAILVVIEMIVKGFEAVFNRGEK